MIWPLPPLPFPPERREGFSLSTLLLLIDFSSTIMYVLSALHRQQFKNLKCLGSSIEYVSRQIHIYYVISRIQHERSISNVHCFLHHPLFDPSCFLLPMCFSSQQLPFSISASYDACLHPSSCDTNRAIFREVKCVFHISQRHVRMWPIVKDPCC